MKVSLSQSDALRAKGTRLSNSPLAGGMVRGVQKKYEW